MGGGILTNQVSSTKDTIVNEFNSSVKKEMSATVENNVDVACENVQKISNATLSGCSVTFGEQVCEASVIANYTGTNQLNESTMQEVFTNSTQALEAQANSGGGILTNQMVFATKTTKNLTNMIVDIAMRLRTECSRNLRAVNEQTIENVSCSNASEVNFAAQTSTIDALADCVSEQAAKSSSNMYMTGLSAQENTVKGSSESSIWAMVIMMLIVPILCFGIPFGLRMGFGVGGKPMSPYLKVIAILLVLLILFGFIWWPGFGAMYLGVYPYEFSNEKQNLDENGQPFCENGQLSSGGVMTEDFMWWDQNCLSSNGGKNGVCDEASQSVHYDGCGVFASCSDPQLATDREQFTGFKNACGRIDSTFVTYCEPSEVSKKTIQPTEGIVDPFPGCKLCSDSKLRTAGLYIKNDKDCETADVSAFYLYAALGKETNSVGQLVDATCGPNNFYCVETVEEFEEASPDECTNMGYQQAKKKFVEVMKACNDINKYSKKKNTLITTTDVVNLEGVELDVSYTLKEQCALDIDNYLDCNPISKECFYVPNSCTYTGEGDEPEKGASLSDYDCSGADEEDLKSCRNDYTGCQDPQYQIDIQATKTMEARCKNAYAEWENIHMPAFYVTISIYSLMFLICLWCGFRYIKQRNKSQDKK